MTFKKALTVFAVTTKPSPSLPPDFVMLWLTIPISSPARMNIGPPELPVLITASVWKNSARGQSLVTVLAAHRALMIPSLTIRNAGFAFRADRITVNLAPADIHKEGAPFDLPIALAILAATGAVTERRPDPSPSSESSRSTAPFQPVRAVSTGMPPTAPAATPDTDTADDAELRRKNVPA